MNKEMIISSNGHETRVAILEDDLVARFVERAQSRRCGQRLQGPRLESAGMQSAFVDIGLERDGFLYVSDVVSPSDLFDDEEEEEEAARKRRPNEVAVSRRMTRVPAQRSRTTVATNPRTGASRTC